MATTGTEKHARLVISLMKGGTKLTRRLFEIRVSELTPTDYIQSPWTVDQFLVSNKGKILANDAGRKKEKTYFPGILDKTNLNHWDLSMFCHVLLEACELDPETGVDVRELRKLRNKLSHLSEPSLDDVKYNLNMNKLEVIFRRTLKKIGDGNLDDEIIGILNSSKNGELSLSDAYKEIYKFFQMEGEIREVLSEHTKDHKAILDKLDIIVEQTKNTDGAAIELPETDVVILVKNCNTEKEKRLSECLQKLIDENINKQTTLADEMSNESFHKLREAVDQAVKTFFSNGRSITSTESKCVLLRVRCLSLKHLVNLFRDCISGKLNEQVQPLEAAVKEIPEFENITLEVAIYTDEFWKVIEKTVSVVEGYVSTSQANTRSVVTTERKQSDCGMSHAVKISIPTISYRQLQTLRESFESGRVTENMNNIQKAACMDLCLTNISIEAELVETPSITANSSLPAVSPPDQMICPSIGTSYKTFKAKKTKSKRRKRKFSTEPVAGLPVNVSTAVTHVSDLSRTHTLQAKTEITMMKEVGTKQTAISRIHDERNLPSVEENDTKAGSKAMLRFSTKEPAKPILSPHQYNVTGASTDKPVSRSFSCGSFDSFSHADDSGFGTDMKASSSIFDSHTISEMFTSDEVQSICSYSSDEEADIEKYVPAELEATAENSKVEILETVEKKLDIANSEVCDEVLIQHGIKLNESFMMQFRSKTSKYPAFYQKFKDPEELKQLTVLNPNLYIPCIIHLEGSHEAYCTPTCKMSGEYLGRIEISGRTKIGQAYNEDEVVVELLDDKNKKEKRYGKVLGVIRRHRCQNKAIKHPVFLCTPDDAESHILRPMCKTVPKIHVIHDLIKQRYKTQKAMRFKVEIYEYDERAEILSNPRIETLSHAEIHSCVFLVAIISWELNQIYPRGAIIKRFPCGDTISSGLAILDLRYEVTKLFSKETVEEMVAITESNRERDIIDMDEEYMQDKTNLRTFTIDRHDVKDLNYAFSLEKVDNGCKVGVHISDVSMYIKKDSPIDKDAYKRGLTVHSGIGSSRYMLPEQITFETCSLLKNKKRPVISIYLFLNNDGRQLQTTKHNYLIELSFIRCCENLSYEEAQHIINKGDDDDSNDELKNDLKYLFRLMYSARKLRLGRSMCILSESEIETEECRKETIETQCCVEELVIIVNKKVAEVMSRHNISIPVYTQQAPSTKDLETFCQKYGSYLDVLVHFQNRQISPFKKPMFEDALQSDVPQKVMVTNAVWETIKALSGRETILDDNLHPVQSVIYAQWLSIQNTSNYRCSSAGGEEIKNFSHGFDVYTHCTSPTRRYTDIIVQRMLHFYLKRHEIQQIHTASEVEEICLHVNSVGGNAIHKNYKRNPRISKNMRYRGIFTLLDMGFKPVLTEDRVTKLECVNCKWRKRLFDIRKQPTVISDRANGKQNKCCESADEPNVTLQSLNPYREVKFIKLQQWARLVKNAADNYQKDLKRNIRQVTAQTENSGLDDVSTECTESSKMQANTIFSHLFHIGQPMNVQTFAKPRHGIIVPQPMLMEMTDSVKLCLQHTDDPVLHLAKYSTEPTLDQYESKKKYASKWLPIVLMESAVNAVSNEEGCIINNVLVKVENETKGSLMLPVNFCEERNIELSGSPDRIFGEEDESRVFDWLCIKCKGSKFQSQADKRLIPEVWVGHAEVTDISLKNEDTYGKAEAVFVISFTLHEKTERFRKEAIGRKEYDNVCSIEILKKSEVDRRIESYLRILADQNDEHVLAVNVALKRKLKPLGRGHKQLSNMIERDLYFSNNSKDPKSKALPKNNLKQQEAIDMALRNQFTLIQGPPGTGKTYTGIKLIYLFNKINDIWSKEGNPRYQVLFCGPSNKSVDLVARWMLHRLGNYRPDFVRIYGRATEVEDFPIPGVSYQSRGNKIHTADDDLQSVTLHHLIRKNRSETCKKINEMDRKFKTMIGNREKPDSKTLKSYMKLLAKASKDEIKKHHVILCTTGFGSNPTLLKAANVHQVIIDEAGMCPEPQCMVPLIATKAKQIVLIGDHKQLRPIVKCKAAAELGLDKSLFERYATTKESIAPFIMLDEQYRMHPSLCEFPSQHFYKGKLRTMRGRWQYERRNIWPTDQTGQEEYPHILLHVEGDEAVLTVNTDEGNEQSRSNIKEINQVVKVYRYLIEENISPRAINIISQYNAQCSEMKETLKKEGFTNYLVNTVVSSQGGEWDYVIFSTVRSLPEYKIETNSTIGWRKHNLGFITDTNQINVALTRARKGLIIIGNKNLLKCDPVWKKLVSHYEQRKCVKYPGEFPPKRTRQQNMDEAQARSFERYGGTLHETQTDNKRAGYDSMGAIPKTGPKYKMSPTKGNLKAPKMLPADRLSLTYDEWPCLRRETRVSTRKTATSFHLQEPSLISTSSVSSSLVDTDNSVEEEEDNEWKIVYRRKPPKK
ncbi:helicase with zinc finger domain 2-like [Mercenaria mercenaria]|uniref:helicase with zinc finger domain 2-like n=1 Tax=Mercenaria mercenaria TaxID=6596 RepID=UPI00234EC9DA|nr:helicase with zinc finger domain 2-like [Mercenaria mercenaria]